MEVLIGLAAIAIVITVGVPSIISLSHDYYLKKTTSNLLSSLTLAQTEAVRQGGISRLCPSSDGKSCRSDGDWNRGWIVFVDLNANTIPEPVEVVGVYDPPKGQIHITASGGFTSEAQFSLDGFLIEDDQPVTGKFRVCYGDDLPGYQEILTDDRGRHKARKSEQPCSET